MGYEILRGSASPSDLSMYFSRCCHLPFPGSTALAGRYDGNTTGEDDHGNYVEKVQCTLLRSDGRTLTNTYPLDIIEENIENFNIPDLGYVTDMFNQSESPLYYARPFGQSAASRGFSSRKFEVSSDFGYPFDHLKAFASLVDAKRYTPFEEGITGVINGDIRSFVISPHLGVERHEGRELIRILMDKKEVGTVDNSGKVFGLRIPKEFLK